MMVPETTGLPVTRVNVPDPLRGILFLLNY